MSMMSTEKECEEIKNLEDLRLECEVSEEVWTEFQGYTGSLGTKLRSQLARTIKRWPQSQRFRRGDYLAVQ